MCAKKKSRLAPDQRVRLLDWVRDNKERLASNRIAHDVLARNVSRELGFDMSKWVLNDAIKAINKAYPDAGITLGTSDAANSQSLVARHKLQTRVNLLSVVVARIGNQYFEHGDIPELDELIELVDQTHNGDDDD